MTVVLQFSLEPQLVIVVSKLFLVHPYFNSIMILILFLKYFFIIKIIKPSLLRSNLKL